MAEKGPRNDKEMEELHGISKEQECCGCKAAAVATRIHKDKMRDCWKSISTGWGTTDNRGKSVNEKFTGAGIWKRDA